MNLGLINLKKLKIMKKIILIIVCIVANFTTFAQVAIGTTSPDTSAALEVKSTSQGFLPPRMTQVQINAIESPAEGLMVYCLDCTPKGIYVNSTSGTGDSSNSEFVNITNGESSGTDASTATVDLISPTGRIWMDRNLGATQAATSTSDAAAFGDLYQWGREKDGHEDMNSPTTSTSATSINPGHSDFIAYWSVFPHYNLWKDGANDPCPTGYRVPALPEFMNERDLFDTENINGAFAALKLSKTGIRHGGTGEIFQNLLNYGGYYWTSTTGPFWSSTEGGWALNFEAGPSFASQYANSVPNGLAVRCIKELVVESIKDTSTEIVELIGPSGRVWMDRNLGATQAATSITDAAAYGDLYQWGRAKDGHQSRTSGTITSITTSAKTGGNGNFIKTGETTDYNWTDFANEDTLWATGVNDPCPTGYRIPTKLELEDELNALPGDKTAASAFEALKLTLSGYRHVEGGQGFAGYRGFIWSSTPNYHLGYRNLEEAFVNNDTRRGNAEAIRCIKAETAPGVLRLGDKFYDIFLGFTFRVTSLSNNEIDIIQNHSNRSDNRGDITIPSKVVYNGINYNITRIGSGYFSNFTSFRDSELTTVTIPSSITSIGQGAFWQNSGTLTTVTVQSTTPPTLEGDAFYAQSIDLIIPSGASKEAYKAAGWIGFKSYTNAN